MTDKIDESKIGSLKDELIHKYIRTMWGGLELTSIRYFIETGTINGSFKENLHKLLSEYATIILINSKIKETTTQIIKPIPKTFKVSKSDYEWLQMNRPTHLPKS